MQERKEQPQLWVVAGPNGSGKSSLVDRYTILLPKIIFINPDNIARELEPNNTVHHSPAIQLKAGKIAVQQQNEMLKNKQSFAFETTFSGNREIEVIKQAKELGYKINIAYICLENPLKNINRVEERANKGGTL